MRKEKHPQNVKFSYGFFSDHHITKGHGFEKAKAKVNRYNEMYSFLQISNSFPPFTQDSIV